MDTALAQALEALKNYSPYVWQVTRRQILIEGISLLVTSGIILVAWMIGMWLILRDESSDSDDKFILGGIITALTFIFGGLMAFYGLSYVLNTDYQVIARLLSLARGGS